MIVLSANRARTARFFSCSAVANDLGHMPWPHPHNARGRMADMCLAHGSGSPTIMAPLRGRAFVINADCALPSIAGTLPEPRWSWAWVLNLAKRLLLLSGSARACYGRFRRAGRSDCRCFAARAESSPTPEKRPRAQPQTLPVSGRSLAPVAGVAAEGWPEGPCSSASAGPASAGSVISRARRPKVT